MGLKLQPDQAKPYLDRPINACANESGTRFSKNSCFDDMCDAGSGERRVRQDAGGAGRVSAEGALGAPEHVASRLSAQTLAAGEGEKWTMWDRSSAISLRTALSSSAI